MAADTPSPLHDATAPLPPGPLLQLADAGIEVDVAPRAGGRIAQIRVDGVAQLIGAGEVGQSCIAWGCYPMLPWVGRIRHGRFAFAGRDWQLPLNLQAHAIHGVGFALPWQVDEVTPVSAALSLALPQDEHWPFGGSARQKIELEERCLRLTLAVQAGAQAMPAELGWHPWFRKPDALDFHPQAMYPRDDEGIAQLPLVAPSAGPWDDCFLHRGDIWLRRGTQQLRLQSGCEHWVVYDGTAHATCVEPQTGPPDAFTLAPRVLAPGQSLQATFQLSWHHS